MRIHLDQVPVRDSSITPEEILLSESQERMLLVCEPKKFPEISKAFAKWGLDAAKIGEVISDRKIELFWHSDLLTSIDPDLLVENAPLYERPFGAHIEKNKVESEKSLPKINSKNLVQEVLSSPEFGSRNSIYRQYDQRVGGSTARGSDHDIAFLRLPDSGRGLAIAVGCRTNLMKMDARVGALDAVFYPALQMAAKGAKAVAATDCLNFGNPEKETIMTEFVVCVDAIVEASLELDMPVVSGNVSFYNETLGENITSTPAIGLVGIRENVLNIPGDRFVKAGHQVLSLKLKMCEAFQGKFTGDFESKKVAGFIRNIQTLCKMPEVVSSQVVGENGLAVEIAKMGFDGVVLGLDSRINLERKTHQYFYEVIVEVTNPSLVLNAISQIFKEDCEAALLGETIGAIPEYKKDYDKALDQLILQTGVRQ